MTPLERKKIETEMQAVKSGRMNLELTIMEREADIERMKASITLQLAREAELVKKLTSI